MPHYICWIGQCPNDLKRVIYSFIKYVVNWMLSIMSHSKFFSLKWKFKHCMLETLKVGLCWIQTMTVFLLWQDKYVLAVSFDLFVCLFVWGLSSNSRIFNSYLDVIITCDGLLILTYAWLSWSLSSKGSLACHTYCGTGHPFIIVISEDPLHLQLSPRV